MMIKRLYELLFPTPALREQSIDRDVVTTVVYHTVESVKELQSDYSFQELSLEHPSTLEQSDLIYIVNNEDYDDFEKNLQKYIQS